jgi:hypothetical protein
VNYFQAYFVAPNQTTIAGWNPFNAWAGDTRSPAYFLARGRRILRRRLARACELALLPSYRREIARSLAGGALLMALATGTKVTMNLLGIRDADGTCPLIVAIVMRITTRRRTGVQRQASGAYLRRLIAAGREAIHCRRHGSYDFVHRGRMLLLQGGER